MKSIHKFLSLFLITAIFSACEKLEMDSPNFDVVPGKLNYKVGDTVRFSITGEANHLTFYSGENGFMYQHKDRTSAEVTPRVQFTTTRASSGQLNTLQLLATTDLTDVDASSVASATWVDLTSRATLSTGGTNTSSGVLDLSDLLASGKPVSFAFKFAASTGTVQPTWTINAFNLTNVMPSGLVTTLATVSTAKFTKVDLENPAASWNFIFNSSSAITGITIAGGNAASAGNLDYMVTRPIQLNRVAPDLGLSIRDLSGNMISEHTHVYKNPGTYKVTFVGINQTSEERKEQVKEVEVTIEP